MISTETFKPIIWCFKFTAFLKSMSHCWDSNLGRLRPYASSGRDRANYIISNIFMRLFILGHIGMIIFVSAILLLAKSIRPEEIICGILCMCLFVMSIVTHLANTFHDAAFITYVNSLLDFHDEHGQQLILEQVNLIWRFKSY